jgi:hypothetical protein
MRFTYNNMNYSISILLLLGSFFCSCNRVDTPKAKNEIQVLIRNVLIWSDTCQAFDLLPVISNENDNHYLGFNIKKVSENLAILAQTGFFSKNFIDNYLQIVETFDKKIRNEETIWDVGDMPSFNFNMSYIDLNPWCLCQGFSVSQFGEIEVLNLNQMEGNLKFKWIQNSDWIDFKFSVIREDNKWKISYMEGFDLNDMPKK